MDAFVTITEDNKTHTWVSNIDVAHKPPIVGSICWVSADSDEALLIAAKDKFRGIGFDVISAELITKSAEDKEIALIVRELADIEEIPAGGGKLTRTSTDAGWPFH